MRWPLLILALYCLLQEGVDHHAQIVVLQARMTRLERRVALLTADPDPEDRPVVPVPGR